MIYDIIIAGGGIAGLNSAYQLLKYYPNAKILILEKEKNVGGRIESITNKYMSIEAGAGRFHSGNKNLFQLIQELGLTNKTQKITGTASYAHNGKIWNSIMDYEKNKKTNQNIQTILQNKIPNPEPALLSALDVILGKENLPNSGIIAKIIIGSYLETAEQLRNTNLIEFAKKIVSLEDVEFLESSFGYYTELIQMNAYDAIYLIVEHLSNKHPYYSMKGGLTQIITELKKHIEKYPNTRIISNRTISQINYNKQSQIYTMECMNVQIKYQTHICICALPKQILEKFRIFKPIKPLLNKIICAPLCRIYSKFPLNKENNEVWFKNLSKLTTNNNLRIVIPIDQDKGVIMSSYSDNKYANYWKELYKKGEQTFNKELIKLLRESTGREVPMPIKSYIYYWECGVGYWGIGANSETISEAMIQPIPNTALFVCGEHYSHKNQQWMEGALETSNKVISRILSKMSEKV
jgi:monoamine oxidase